MKGWEWRFLSWWGKKGGFFLFFLCFGLMVFVLLFGNYPQWEYQNKRKTISEYFSADGEENLKLSYFTDQGDIFYLKFRYQDGYVFKDQLSKRPNQDAILKKYKAVILNKICLSEELTDRLHSGQRISVDLIDGDREWGVSQLFNMFINYDRCYT
ncbi:hypothetical protein [Aliiglaciecola litoralis]|uniref:Uncharacterized protein n=1 Tax=Aliiglaciecola litoralis TaxID=582857 RepID=A0ABP3X6F2_9ALTE